jgi:hypothetical protein
MKNTNSQNLIVDYVGTPGYYPPEILAVQEVFKKE